MTLTTFSIPLATFDPLLCQQQFFPQGPGFLETLNPRAKTGRYTIVPLRVVDSFRLTGKNLQHQTKNQVYELTGDPLDQLARVLQERAIQQPVDTPFPGGFFGFFAYDLAQYIEALPQQAQRDLQVPILQLDWVDLSAVYDHHQLKLTLACLSSDINLSELAQQIAEQQQNQCPADRLHITELPEPLIDGLANTLEMAKQKFRTTRRSVFSGMQTYIS